MCLTKNPKAQKNTSLNSAAFTYAHLFALSNPAAQPVG